MTHNNDRANAQANGIGETLTPPSWWEAAAPPPPVGDVDGATVIGDDVDAGWFDLPDKPNPEIWRGNTWRVTVHGIDRIDGRCSIVSFDNLWCVDTLRRALAIDPTDHDDLREALRIARLIDAYWVGA